jgi:hypothetical protein
LVVLFAIIPLYGTLAIARSLASADPACRARLGRSGGGRRGDRGLMAIDPRRAACGARRDALTFALLDSRHRSRSSHRWPGSIRSSVPAWA